MSEATRRRHRWWRRGAWILLALVAVPVLVVLGLEIALRQSGVRQAVGDGISGWVDERTGLSLTIDDLRLSLLRGVAQVDGLSLGEAGKPPFLEAERIEVAWQLSSLWDEPLTLSRLIITGPELDLEAPLPSPPSSSAGGSTGFAVAIERFELVEGHVDGPVLPEELRSWIEDWWLQDLKIQGRYGRDGLAAMLDSRFLWLRTDGEQVEVEVEGELVGPQEGPWHLSQLSLDAEGLQGELEATIGAGETDPLQISYDITLEPHLLVPVPVSAGPIRARGDLDGRKRAGDLQLAAAGVSVELASPWLPSEILEDQLLEDWSLDLDADLELVGAEGGLATSGTAELLLAHRGSTWVTAEVDLVAVTGAGGVEAGIEAQILPDRPGRRSVQASLSIPEWTEIGELTVTDSDVQITDTDLAELRRDLAALWPESRPDSVDASLTGVLQATAQAEGPATDLQFEVAAQWRNGESDYVELHASGSPDRVIADSAKGSMAGRQFSGHGYVALPAPIALAEVEFELERPLPHVSQASFSARLENGSAWVRVEPRTTNGVTSTFEATIPLDNFRSLPADFGSVAGLPLVRAAGPLQIAWQVPLAEWGWLVSETSQEIDLSALFLGSRGSAEFDLARPLAGIGELVIEGLETGTEEFSVAAEGPLKLRLQRGELILEPARLRTDGGVLEVEAWSEIATDWRPEDSVQDLLRRFRIEASGAVPMALLTEVVEGIQTDGDLQASVSLAGSSGDLQGEIRILGPDAVAVVGDEKATHLFNPVLDLSFAGDRIRINRAQVEIDDGEIGATGEIQIDPDRPFDATGWFEIAPLDLAAAGYTLRGDGPLRVEFADGRLDLGSIRLQVNDQPFALTGSIELDPNWSSDASWTSLVEAFELDGRGTMAAAWLNPFLAGGSAEGLLEVDFAMQGSPDNPRGPIRIDGPKASVLFISPYVAKLEAPELDLELADGRAQIRDGRLRLNGGDVELDGSVGLDGVDLFAAFDSLRFRLDHGLLVRVDGEMNLTLDPEFRGRLTGEIIVDQGSLTRPISIDRDFLTDLLSPIDLTGTEASPFEQIELDLVLNTRRGVLLRNNVADLAVQWDEVRIRGNLLQPVIDGQFRVEPGGRAFLFGQTLRIDRGVMTFPGQPGVEAILDLETTSSLDDPSISRLAGDDALSLGQASTSEEAADLESRARDAGWSAAAFVSEQVATRIAEAIPSARFTFRPILIFGEADPEARLTVGREFSRYVTLAASIDLRNAERQTYLMDAHDFPRLPGLVVQVFTNDREQEGFTLQHRLRLGSYRRTAPTGPTLRRMAIDEVPEISNRALRRSVGLVKGDRATADDLFLAEVEVGEFLRGKGYPDARIEVGSRPVPERPKKVDLEISIEPGPFVRFDFSGEELPRALQRSITPLYRSDFHEPVALAEMESQTVRAFRSLGFLFPMVQITVEVEQNTEGREERMVSIFSVGGEQAQLDAFEISGLSEREAVQVSEVFSTRLQRVELATAEPSADRRLLSAVRGLGYPDPEILDRSVSEDSRSLTVRVEPGSLRHLDSVAMQGVDADEASRLIEVAAVEAGEVARWDRIASGALAIESELRSDGFVNALVRPRLEIGEADPAMGVDLVYDVERGTAYTVAETDFSGLRSTSRRWATNVAEMESGAPLREDEVAAARSRLYETGLFTMVTSDSFVTDGGGTEIRFDVEERPRFSVAYGLRWDGDEDTQAVVDVIDQNLLGRSVTLGLRALYKQDDWQVRLGAGVPRLFGSRAVLEVFGSYRDLFEELEHEFFLTQFDEQIVEASLQVAYPFGQNLSGRFYGRYRTADLVVTDIEKDPDPDFPLPPLDFQFNTPLLGTLWIYDTRNRELVLNRGVFASLDLSGTGEALNSDFEYIRMFTQFNLYRPFKRWAGRRLSWAQSLRLGLADSFDQELDRNDRFFAGGQYSVRGYPTDSLGPVEELGEVVRPLGGKTLVVINQELRFDLLGPVAGLVFFDLGNVWEDTAEFSSDLFKSAGLGLRAVTPVGLLRLDWAFPLDRRELDPSSKVYFGFGNTF